MIPVRNIREFNDVDGKITLLIPKFKHGWLRRWLIPRNKSPFFRIHLDETGSHIWQLIDGLSSVEEICLDISKLHRDEGKSVDQIEERVTQFLTSLYKKQYIFLLDKSNN
jgi:hypothetical protein